MTNEYEYTRDLDLLGDWLDEKGYTEEAGLITRSMDFMHEQARRIAELRKEADMMHSEYKTARARIAELEAENARLKQAMSKPWMGSARAALEKNDG
jgi:predicted nuclease with TOPRIM domain